MRKVTENTIQVREIIIKHNSLENEKIKEKKKPKNTNIKIYKIVPSREKAYNQSQGNTKASVHNILSLFL